jgi:hypothetical protein
VFVGGEYKVCCLELSMVGGDVVLIWERRGFLDLVMGRCYNIHIYTYYLLVGKQLSICRVSGTDSVFDATC